MADEEFCQNCDQKHDCQKIYRKLGNVKSPSVISKVVVAFLLPIVVFIAALAAFEEILSEALNSKEVQTAVSFLLALLLTSICIMIVKGICHLYKGRNSVQREGKPRNKPFDYFDFAQYKCVQGRFGG